MDPISRLYCTAAAAYRARRLPHQDPSFAVEAEGPPHAPRFRATCTLPRGPDAGLPERTVGQWCGTKREARRDAADAVLEALRPPAPDAEPDPEEFIPLPPAEAAEAGE